MSNSRTIDHPCTQSNSNEKIYGRIFVEVFTFIILVSLTASILLSFVIMKYKRMRKDATYQIFLQVNILQAIYLVGILVTLRAGVILTDFYSSSWFCFMDQIEANLSFGILWLIFLLVIDWYIRVYHKDRHVKSSKIYKFFVIVLYILVVITTSITGQACSGHFLVLYTYLILLCVAALLLLVLFVMNIVHAIKKRRLSMNNQSGNFGLAIANIYAFSWVPGVIGAFLASIYGSQTPANLAILMILFGVAHFSPVYILIHVYNNDDNYNVFLKQVFRCRYTEYTNESLDRSGRSVVYNDCNGVLIPENVLNH